MLKRALTLAAASAMAALFLPGGVAAAEVPAVNCVTSAPLPSTSTGVTCFPTFSQAISFATLGAVSLPISLQGRDAANEVGAGAGFAGALAAASASGQSVLAIHFDDLGFGGGTFTVTGPAGGCAAGASFLMPDLTGYGWSDRISATKNYGCAVSRHVQDVNFAGGDFYCQYDCIYVGDDMNDQTTSVHYYTELPTVPSNEELDVVGDAPAPSPDAPTSPLYVPPAADVTAKLTDYANAVTAMQAGPGIGFCWNAVDLGGCGGGSVPNAREVGQLGYLHKQETSYSCATASVRSILHYMIGVDYAESGLRTEMGTRPKDTRPGHEYAGGTVWTEVGKALNHHQSRDGFIGEPEWGNLTEDEIMSRVVYDVAINHRAQHAAVLNVDQSKLAYWNRRTAGTHYLTAYGYNQKGRIIRVGDVYYGSGVFGKHDVDLSQVHRAELANKGLVIW